MDSVQDKPANFFSRRKDILKSKMIFQSLLSPRSQNAPPCSNLRSFQVSWGTCCCQNIFCNAMHHVAFKQAHSDKPLSSLSHLLLSNERLPVLLGPNGGFGLSPFICNAMQHATTNKLIQIKSY